MRKNNFLKTTPKEKKNVTMIIVKWANSYVPL